MNLPSAVPSSTSTYILRQHGDGLLRTNSAVNTPAVSATLYDDALKFTEIATSQEAQVHMHDYIMQISLMT